MSRDILEIPAPPADARLAYGPDPLHFGDLRLPSGPGPHPVAVVIHGGFWRARYDLEHIGHLCAALTVAGLATWNVEYRRIGNSGGGYPGTFLDLGQAVDYLRELAPAHGLDLGRVVAVGHSAGGHLALWAAGRPRVPPGDLLWCTSPLPLRGAVALAGVVDLRRAWELRLSDNVVETFIGGPPDRYPERYRAGSPIELVPLGVPHALVHGTADENVPYEISERYQAAATAAGDDARLVALPEADHFVVIDPRAREWPEIEAAIARGGERWELGVGGRS